MHALLPSFDRRGLRLSSLVLAGAALLGACDNDRPVGPNAAAIPQSANPALVAKGGSLIIAIVDQNQQPPTTLGAQFTVANSGNGIAYFAVDNMPGDADPAIGRIRMNGLLGNFTICQTVAPTNHDKAQACQSVSITPGIVVTRTFVNPIFGRLQWAVNLHLGYKVAGPLGGATFIGYDGGKPDTIVDNSAKDLDPNPGKFEVKVYSGAYDLCPGALPATFMYPGPTPPNNGCTGFPVPAGTTFVFGTFGVIPEYSAIWGAQDIMNNYQYAGPSTYEVKGGASGTFFATVEDNGKYDLDSDLGELWLQLPEDGDYEVCQTIAPPKLQIAADPCRKITVIKGEVTSSVGAFQSLPL